MDEREALIHIKTLIKVASGSDDIEILHKHLRMMRVIMNKALPVRRKPKLKLVKK